MKRLILALMLACTGALSTSQTTFADPARVQEPVLKTGRVATGVDVSKVRTAPADPAKTRPVAPPITTTKSVLDAIGKIDVSVSTNAYSSQMAKGFDAMDLNKNGVLAWFGPQVSIDPDPSAPEPLQAMFDQCFIVKYTHTPASKVKDAAKPGAWIETPASTTVADWKSWREALADAQSANHQECTEYATQKQKYCKFSNGVVSPVVCSAFGGCDCPPGSSAQTKDVEVCSKWVSKGQGTLKADFLKLVSQQLKAEDWNANGQIDAGEGQYLCPVFGSN